MNNSKRILISSVVASIFLFVFNMLRFDIAMIANRSFGLLIIVGLISFIPYILYTGWAIWLIISAIKNRKNNIKDKLISIIVISLTVILLTIIPYTDTYINMNYTVNKNKLNETVDMIVDGDIELARTNNNEYIAPYRLTSYTGQLYTYDKDDITKVMFYVFSGYRGGVVLVYSTDDSELMSSDFQRRFENIQKVDENWYSAYVSY
jgi:hypothetical protein